MTLGRVIFEIYDRSYQQKDKETDKRVDRHTDKLIAIQDKTEQNVSWTTTEETEC